jgi:hypothetical protein
MPTLRTLRLSAKGGLYNPQVVRTYPCMLANVYTGAGSYKRVFNFIKNNPQPTISEFFKIVDYVSFVTFPSVK